MLETLRNAGKSWVAKALMIFLAASFGIWGVQDVFRGNHTGALATVGDRDVSAAEYTNSFRQMLQNIARTTGQAVTQDDARKLGYDRLVLDRLIQQAAIDTQINKLGLAVSPQAVAEAAKGNPAFQGPDGKFDPVAFARAMQNNDMNEATFIAGESRNMMRQAVLSSVAANFGTPITLIEAVEKFRSEQRDAKFFTIRATPADVPAATESEIKDQYQKTPAAYTAPEFRAVGILKVEPADLTSSIAVSPEEVKSAFDKLKGEYSTPERRTILQIPFPSEDEAKKARERLAGGMDFIALATERGLKESDYQLADKSASDLLDKSIASAAFALQQGTVSDVVKGSLVTALLKVTKVTPGTEPTLDQLKDKISERVKLEKAHEQIQAIFDNVENARNNNSKFEDIAKELKIPFQIIPAVSAAGLDKDGKDVVLPDKQDLLRAVFSSDVGDITSPLNPTNSYIWYEVREVIPSALKPLDAVRTQVQSDIGARKVRELLEDRAKKLVVQLKGGNSIDQVAQQEKSAVQQAQGLRRNEATPDFDIPSLTALFSLPPNGYGWALEGDGQSAKVMQSTPVIAAPFDAASAEGKAMSQELAQAAGASLSSTYLQAVRQEVPVTINEQVWQQASGSAP